MSSPLASSHARSVADTPAINERYVRQEIFRSIGRTGQQRLGETHVALIGCGALGTAVADLLVRAGIGRLSIIDRDYVEIHNLQRQSLFSEDDVASHAPKAIAAQRVLKAVNSNVEVESVVTDFNGSNAEQLTRDTSIIVDGTDNFETRYLLNDLAVKNGKPWVYGGVVASQGTTMTIRPGVTPCLRCVFPEPPEVGTAPTCDTAGVLGPAVHAIAAIEAAEVIKIAVGDLESLNSGLISLDLWNLSFEQMALGSPSVDCPACGQRQFEFLERSRPSQSTVLCGHDAVQVLPNSSTRLDLSVLAERLRPLGDVMESKFLVRFNDPLDHFQVTVFPDGRAIIKGTTDETEARSVYARFVGA